MMHNQITTNRLLLNAVVIPYIGVFFDNINCNIKLIKVAVRKITDVLM